MDPFPGFTKFSNKTNCESFKYSWRQNLPKNSTSVRYFNRIGSNKMNSKRENTFDRQQQTTRLAVPMNPVTAFLIHNSTLVYLSPPFPLRISAEHFELFLPRRSYFFVKRAELISVNWRKWIATRTKLLPHRWKVFHSLK